MSKFLENRWNLWIPEPNTGCYIWLGSATGGAQRNRPMVTMGWSEKSPKKKKVARLVCEEVYGPLGKLEAAHKPDINCCGAICVNPDHLYPATRSQNYLDIPFAIRSAMGKHAVCEKNRIKRAEIKL